uniref:Uncharacterized protein n=1 Tax=Arundo donax TaxID=35708 RepID=A0A0A9HEI0_ARUDO
MSDPQPKNRLICMMQDNDQTHIVINEYGSNWIKSKFDPLVAIEAKIALKSTNLVKGVSLESILGLEEKENSKGDMLVNKLSEEQILEGTQEGLKIDISSQEEDMGVGEIREEKLSEKKGKTQLTRNKGTR